MGANAASDPRRSSAAALSPPSSAAAVASVARRKARIVAVGAVGLDVPRREFYPKELELVVSCSYGPGRYDIERTPTCVSSQILRSCSAVVRHIQVTRST